MAPLDEVRVVPRGCDVELRPSAWYFDIPAVAQLRVDELCLAPGVTVLLGENGSGKSTLAEATHSPLPAACPGATVLELGEHGLRPARFDEDVVRDWRAFLDSPERLLRHL